MLGNKKKEILHFENISFIRDNRNILEDINLHINEDENWAILGLNGSGKSTLLSMIPAYTFATKGEIRVFGKIFGTCIWQNIREKLGFVSSTLNNFSNTLNKQKLEEVVISGKFNSIGIYQEITKIDKEEAFKIMKSFKIEHLKDRFFSSLSQGEQRKALLARAFMCKPKLLILDEPCSGLDIVARESFLSILEEIGKSQLNKIPFIYVSHQIEEIIPSISHVAIIKDGKIIKKGGKKEILTNKNLSELFGFPVRIEWENKRPWLIVK